MKATEFYLLVALVGFLSCTNKEKNNSIGNALIPTENIRIVLDSFVKENSQYAIYELYIDKDMPVECTIMIYAGKNSLTELKGNPTNQTPVNYTTISGKKFNIFSGVESYFKVRNGGTRRNISEEIGPSTFWIVRDSLGILNIEHKETSTIVPYPFMPLPKFKETVIFKPPF